VASASNKFSSVGKGLKRLFGLNFHRTIFSIINAI
jgi:hypothetical protein